MKRLHTYSQHFLRSPRLVAELIGHTNIRKNDTVIDIGAGSGVISSALARRAKQVIAIEPEMRAFALLQKNLRMIPNIKLINGDFMEYELPARGRYKIFSNIPFSMSSEIVQRLINAKQPPGAIYLIVQKQFARKLMSSPNTFTSQLGMRIGPWWSARIRKPLNKYDFTPPPAVDTVLLELKPRESPLLPVSDSEKYAEFVRSCFDKPLYFAKYHPTPSPSRLSVEEFVGLFKKLP